MILVPDPVLILITDQADQVSRGPVKNAFHIRNIRIFRITGIADVHSDRMPLRKFLHDDIKVSELGISLKPVQSGAGDAEAPAAEDIFLLVFHIYRILLRKQVQFRNPAVHHDRHRCRTADISGNLWRTDHLGYGGRLNQDSVGNLTDRLLRVDRNHLSSAKCQ